MDVVVVGAVGGQSVGPPAGPADVAADRRHRVDERDQLGDVVAVAAGEVPGERDAAPPSMRRWCLEPFRARSTGLGPVAEPPFSPDVTAVATARDQSRRPRRSVRPSSAVQPLPHPGLAATPPAAASRSSPTRTRAPAAGAATPALCRRTKRIRDSASRSGQPLPARVAKPPLDRGSNGSTRSHNSSDTTHGAAATGTPPSFTTDADGLRRQERGPFISIRVLSSGGRI